MEPKKLTKKELLSNSIALMFAAKAGDLTEVERLIPISYRNYVKTYKGNSNTALVLAAASVHSNCVVALAPVSDLTVRGGSGGRTALHFCILADDTRGVEALMRIGGETLADIADDSEQPALHYAASLRSIECIEILAKYCDINVRNSCGKTPLMLAVSNWGGEGPESVIKLLELGADAKLQDAAGFTALMHAVLHKENASLFVDMLLPLSDIEARDANGLRAQDIAKNSRSPDIADQIDAFVEKQELEATTRQPIEPGQDPARCKSVRTL